jgi:uncharacterized membrane protein YeiH
VVRDLLSNQVPLILQKEVYASACLVGGLLLVLWSRTSHSHPLGALLAALAVIAQRLLALHFNWALPKATA